MPALKSAAVRIAEVREIYERLAAVGVHRSTCPELDVFWVAANEFVRDGTGSNGAIPLAQVQRKLEYRLATVEGRKTDAVIVYTGPKEPAFVRHRKVTI
jgi:hypothetical protein